MTSFLFVRTIELIATLLVVVTVAFFLLRFLPGGPFDDFESVAPEVQTVLNEHYHLDQPLFFQYVNYVRNVFRGDFGVSFQFPDEPVVDIVFSSLPFSIQLGAMALFLSVFLGIFFGILAAAMTGSSFEKMILWLAGSGIAMPSFLVAPVLVLIFAVYFKWLPPALWEGPSSWVLPVTTLSVRPISIIARLVRSSAMDVIHQDFITAARGRGATERRLYFVHVLKNSLLPVLGVLGQMVAGVLSGSFVVEMIFAIPGAGRHLVESVLARDYPLVMAMVIIYTVLLILAHWWADLMIRWLDPRVREHAMA